MIEDLQIMIDTVRFRGEFLDLRALPLIEFHLEKLTKTKQDITLYEFTTGQLKGSYDSRISFSIKDKDWLYNPQLGRCTFEPVHPYFVCELSLHKFFLGHNVFGFGDDLSLIYRVYDFLEETFEVPFINRDSCQITRIDLAESYKFDNQEQIDAVFHGLKNHRRYRTKPLTYGGTGIYYPGTLTTFKVYDKHVEFKKHDLARLRTLGSRIDLDGIYEMSKNVVRMECEIHKKKLNEIYGACAYVEDLIMSKIIDLKDVYLREKRRLIFEAHDEVALKTIYDVQTYLFSNFTRRKATPMYAFWSSMIAQGEEQTREIFGRATFYKYKKEFKEIGIPFYEYGFLKEDSPKTDISRTVELFPANNLLRAVGN